MLEVGYGGNQQKFGNTANAERAKNSTCLSNILRRMISTSERSDQQLFGRAKAETQQHNKEKLPTF